MALNEALKRQISAGGIRPARGYGARGVRMPVAPEVGGTLASGAAVGGRRGRFTLGTPSTAKDILVNPAPSTRLNPDPLGLRFDRPLDVTQPLGLTGTAARFVEAIRQAAPGGIGNIRGGGGFGVSKSVRHGARGQEREIPVPFGEAPSQVGQITPEELAGRGLRRGRQGEHPYPTERVNRGIGPSVIARILAAQSMTPAEIRRRQSAGSFVR